MVSQENISNRPLNSGEHYNLKQLFSGRNDKIVIPDLQRDYCWGTTNDLVGNFIDGIIRMWANNTNDITMGIIYGYQDPLTPEHIQLCDGQQRLTTLFLLIGMINKESEGNPFKDCLISDFEFNRDDQEPYLQYSIRESSLYFLSDLTCFYFLDESAKGHNNDGYVKECNTYYEGDICYRPWYKASSYDVDPTIQNILAALKTIDKKLNDFNAEQLKCLGKFVTENIFFLYFDMDNRANGEETFVVINTTGEPLTACQNLKPLFIMKENEESRNKIASNWEKMETWFWENRIKGIEHTADEGMEVFLHLVRILSAYPYENAETLKKLIDTKKAPFPHDKMNGDTLFKYFEAYKKLYEKSFATKPDLKTKRLDNKLQYTDYKDINKFMYIVLPMLCYCYTFLGNISDSDIERMFHLFSNMRRYDTRLSESATKTSIDMILSMGTQNIDCLIKSPMLLDEEKRKLEILNNTQTEREKLEFEFAKVEDNSILNGRLSILLSWSNNINDFWDYFLKFKSIWINQYGSDLLRCSLLAYGLSNYPLDGHQLGCEANEWYNIIDKNRDEVKNFLNEATENNESNYNYDKVLQPFIEEYNNKKNIWYPLIKNPELLQDSNYKYVRICPNNMILVMNKQNRDAGYIIIFYGKTIPCNLLEKYNLEKYKWGWLGDYAGLLYADHCYYNLTIELIHNETADGFKIQLFERENNNREKFNQLNKIINDLECEKQWDGKWQTNKKYSGDEAIEMMEKIAEQVNNYADQDDNAEGLSQDSPN